MWYALAADLIVVIHILYVAYVVVGLAAWSGFVENGPGFATPGFGSPISLPF